MFSKTLENKKVGSPAAVEKCKELVASLGCQTAPKHDAGDIPWVGPWDFLIFSLMALIRDPICQYFSMGFRGQPSTTRRMLLLCQA